MRRSLTGLELSRRQTSIRVDKSIKGTIGTLLDSEVRSIRGAETRKSHVRPAPNPEKGSGHVAPFNTDSDSTSGA